MQILIILLIRSFFWNWAFSTNSTGVKSRCKICPPGISCDIFSPVKYTFGICWLIFEILGGVIVANLYGIREADWIIMILPLRTSHCVNYTLIDRRKNCPLHGCNFCPWKFDVSCSIFSQLHYIFINTFPLK